MRPEPWPVASVRVSVAGNALERAAWTAAGAGQVTAASGDEPAAAVPAGAGVEDDPPHAAPTRRRTSMVAPNAARAVDARGVQLSMWPVHVNLPSC